MERLCDEVVQIVFYDLADPGPLTLVNKRFYHFSQDPYIRAHYFLSHYGPTEAIFHALGRGKILNEQVLDILLTSGAHLSRYLVQVSMHHYFHTATYFIKSNWVRNVPFGVFMHFLKVYYLLTNYTFFLQVYQDPLMAQFPLALAIEPRLLPYAVDNGFTMDSKYRDFVFRKMFERTSTNETEQIVHNVKELCRLDTTMFVSRTVAAEVCMEAKTNVAGYTALKALDKCGDLRFELAKTGEVVLNYGIREIHNNNDGTGRKGLTSTETKELIMELISRCLEVPCKGKLLNELKSSWPSDVVNDALKTSIEKHRIGVEDLPPSDDFIACRNFKAKLSQDYARFITFNGEQGDSIEHEGDKCDVQVHSELDEPGLGGKNIIADNVDDSANLGHISQETLTSMIRNDELMPVRPRRRTNYHHYHGTLPTHLSTKLSYPDDALPVAQWVKKAYGHRSLITAIFMIHAVINENDSILECYLSRSADSMRHAHARSCERVPVTLKHFKLLAHLGKQPRYRLYHEIESNCEFFLDEEDYIKQDAKSDNGSRSIKDEASLSPSTSPRAKTEARRRKRPRRSATAVRSYVIPDSDDDAIVDDEEVSNKPRVVESNLQKWILHLSELLKDEQHKHNERKRKHNASLEPGVKSRVYKSDFYRSLTSNLRDLRKSEDAKQIALYGHVNTLETYTSDDDDDYLHTRTKRRKTTRQI
ncbi:hypothetical protein H0H87_006628 [Tephrocybe sp. NHM501043]|nr:hypothetical protein H0H87_006628 [Tephrocybe sp. NHM501043]